jgi:hypothetical protein
MAATVGLVHTDIPVLTCLDLLQGFMRIRRNHGKHGKCALASYPAMVFRNQPKPSQAQAAKP